MTKRENNPEVIKDIPESYQRYIDAIYKIARKNKAGWVTNTELSKKMNINPASISGMLDKLKEKNLIQGKKGSSFRLTDKGKELAIYLDDAHELLRTFFKDVLKIKDINVVEDLSCDIEHHITSEVKESFRKFLKEYLDN